MGLCQAPTRLWLYDLTVNAPNHPPTHQSGTQLIDPPIAGWATTLPDDMTRPVRLIF